MSYVISMLDIFEIIPQIHGKLSGYICLSGVSFSFLTLHAVQVPYNMFTDCAQSSTSAQPGTIIFFLRVY